MSVKKKIKPGLIELDDKSSTLIVHVTIQMVDDTTSQCLSLTTEQRRFKLKSFTLQSNVEKFAEKLIEKVDVLHVSKLGRVIELLQQLRDRLEVQNEHMLDIDDEDDDGKEKSAVVMEKNKLSSTAPLVINRFIDPNAVALTKSKTRASDESLMSATGTVRLKKRETKREEEFHMSDEEKDDTHKMRSGLVERRGNREYKDKEKYNERKEEKDRREKDAERERERDRQKEERREKEREQEKAKRREQRAVIITDRQRVRGVDLVAALLSEYCSTLTDVDTIIEYLYDETPAKVEATSSLLALASQTKNLIAVFAGPERRSNLLEILARVLSEERKKSQDLLLLLLAIFYLLSRTINCHEQLSTNKVPELCLKIVALEHQRLELRASQNKLKATPKTREFVDKQNRILYFAFSILLHMCENLQVELKLKQRELIPLLMRTVSRNQGIIDNKAVAMHSSSNNTSNDPVFCELLVVVFDFCKKLSVFEENKLEMVKGDICSSICYYLSQSQANKVLHDGFVCESWMRLLFNLTFDRSQRHFIASNPNLISKLLEVIPLSKITSHNSSPLLHALSHHGVRVLYSLSMDTDLRPMINRAILEWNPQWLSLLIQAVVNTKAKLVDDNLVALGVNLLHQPTEDNESLCALDVPLLSKSGQKIVSLDLRVVDPVVWSTMIKRVCNGPDVPCAKLLHVCVVHNEEAKRQCIVHVHELVSAASRCANPVMAGLLLSILCDMHGTTVSSSGEDDGPSNETASHHTELGGDINWSEIVSNNQFVSYLVKALALREDDVKLLCLRMLNRIVTSEAVARKLSEVSSAMGSQGLSQQLLTILLGRSHDIDLVAQALYLCFTMTLYSSSRIIFLKQSKLIDSVLGYTTDELSALRSVAHACLDGIVEYSEEWADKIKAIRFETYNQHWLACVQAVPMSKRVAIVQSQSSSSPQSVKAYSPYELSDEDERHQSVKPNASPTSDASKHAKHFSRNSHSSDSDREEKRAPVTVKKRVTPPGNKLNTGRSNIRRSTLTNDDDIDL